MILKHNKALIFTSLLTLLPIPLFFLMRNRFPAELLSGFSVFFFLMPLTLLAGQWVCVFFTRLDKSNEGRNQKVQQLILWIMPLLSNLMCGVFFALLLDAEFSPFAIMNMGWGLFFVLIGNYLPKTRMNTTIGIKMKWTYSSEENWNATHRFAGRLWVSCGIVLIPMGFLPEESAIIILFVFLMLMVLLPMFYSWNFYRKELVAGKELNTGYPTASKKAVKLSLVFLAALLLFLCSILWTGDLNYRMEAESFTVEADWYTDLTLRYEDIQSIEYREGDVPGSRTGGYGSLRLLMGFFHNEEFGLHTRYTYYKPESCVVLTTTQHTIVLSGKTVEDTLALYEALRAAAGK